MGVDQWDEVEHEPEVNDDVDDIDMNDIVCA